jgi:hypothetical protein
VVLAFGGREIRSEVMSVSGGRVARAGGLAPVLLVPAAAFAVHQLRYYLAFGSGVGAALQRTGHSYLHSVVPWIVLLLGLAFGGFLWALGRAMGGQRSLSRYTASFLGLWLTCWACLVAIFAAQEFLEGVFATGHPVGLVGIFGYGGWWAVPVSACVALVLAALFHGARWALDEVAQRHAGPRSGRAPRAAVRSGPEAVWVARVAPLAEGWSGRGPPR